MKVNKVHTSKWWPMGHISSAHISLHNHRNPEECSDAAHHEFLMGMQNRHLVCTWLSSRSWSCFIFHVVAIAKKVLPPSSGSLMTENFSHGEMNGFASEYILLIDVCRNRSTPFQKLQTTLHRSFQPKKKFHKVVNLTLPSIISPRTMSCIYLFRATFMMRESQ